MLLLIPGSYPKVNAEYVNPEQIYQQNQLTDLIYTTQKEMLNVNPALVLIYNDQLYFLMGKSWKLNIYLILSIYGVTNTKFKWDV